MINDASATLLAAGIAALVATVGYLVSQHLGRRERKAERFAEALTAAYDYGESPYRAYRRLDDSAEARRDWAEAHGRAAQGIRYHSALLKVEAPLAARAYHSLFMRIRPRARFYRAWAWLQPSAKSDAEMAFDPPFTYYYDEEVDLLIHCMRHELAWLPDPIRRRRLQRRIDVLRSKRDQEAPLTRFTQVDEAQAAERSKITAWMGDHLPGLPG